MKPQRKGREKPLFSLVGDAIAQVQRSGRQKALGFFSQGEQERLCAYLGKRCPVAYRFFGGHDAAQRTMLCLASLEEELTEEVFPLCPMTLTYRKEDKVSHRDCLGSLLALGLERTALGDFLLEEGRCVFFLRQELASYVESQLTKVGRVGVTVEKGAKKPYPQETPPVPLSVVVSSLRLDCVVAVLCHLSREKAKEKIALGQVAVREQVCLNPAKLLEAGDRLSLRHVGKIKIETIDGTTKKGRLHLTVLQYTEGIGR